MATAGHKFPKLVFSQADQTLLVCLEELHSFSKDAFRKAPHATNDNFLSAKMSPHLKKLINYAHLENIKYECIVAQVEKSWSRTVWRHLMGFKSTQCANTVPTRVPTDPNRLAKTVKNIAIKETNVTSWEKSHLSLILDTLILQGTSSLWRICLDQFYVCTSWDTTV